jgi:hypothetical protein
MVSGNPNTIGSFGELPEECNEDIENDEIIGYNVTTIWEGGVEDEQTFDDYGEALDYYNERICLCVQTLVDHHTPNDGTTCSVAVFDLFENQNKQEWTHEQYYEGLK